MRKKIILLLTLVLAFTLILNRNTVNAQEKFVDVQVEATWYPYSKDTQTVYEELRPIRTHPNAYPLSEVAKYNDNTGKYEIDYMGKPRRESGESGNNFMYVGNLYFTDKFHRIVAQAYNTYDLGGDYKSSVIKVKYGDFEHESLTEGLHGMYRTEYQENKTLELYIETKLGAHLSTSKFKEEVMNIDRPSTKEEFVKKLFSNVESIETYNFFAETAEEYRKQIKIIINEDNINDYIDKIFLYKYDSLESDKGDYLRKGENYINIKESFDPNEMELGKYEVVLPIFWDKMIPNYLSNPQTFSRNRYKVEDTVHFTLIVSERKGKEVKVVYLDEEDNELSKPIILEGLLNEPYTTEEKQFDDYTLVESPKNKEGKFTDESQLVKYIYKKIVLPENPDPVEPEKPDPEVPVEPEKPTEPKEVLPPTGLGNELAYLSKGMILLGSLLLMRHKRKD